MAPIKPILILSLFFTFSHLFAVQNPKVLFIVIDGVRDLEIQGKAEDDNGKVVSTESLFPEISTLKKQGLFLPKMEISNPKGKSLPGYADLFTGARQERILSNDPSNEAIKTLTPTVFETVQSQLKLQPTDIAVFASWKNICQITHSEKYQGSFNQSCGWEKGKYVKPEIFEDSKSDADTFLQVLAELPKTHPRLAFVHFGDADEEAHLQKTVGSKKEVSYGIFHYHQALKASDYYIGRLWKALQEDPFYKDSTYLFITTDHGRDDTGKKNLQWSEHGNCLFCDGYRKIFGLILGPGISPEIREEKYTHVDFAPTLANLFGTTIPTATGKPIPLAQSNRSLTGK